MATTFRTALAASTLATVSLLSLPAHAHGEPQADSGHTKVGVMQEDRIDIAETLVQTGKLLEAAQ
ncbi:hypothetical protein NLX86_16715 [Streptomyces sp. A3M-1-3]|uniref:hypothetical protein n=1 Tax=Streptomyces sp. A3M-1-3 TaxID=2962044 RepID=UPI0020B83977|nr:hypothetical protein [Streptomyces sp. A3M-1-3]MCP3819680.1 hypothetical protein [Streptomyces sp. A3M-1-3]